MRKPNGKLPFKIIEGVEMTWIDDADGQSVCNDLYQEDAEYLVQAANNFPIAIELFKKLIEGNYIPNSRISYEVKQFLKLIE